MPQSIVMPSLGMYTAEGTLVSWLAATGAPVKSGQVIAEIETEKAVNELVAPADGMLHQVAPLGTRLAEEALIGYILAPGEAPPGQEPAAAPALAVAATNGTSERSSAAGGFVKASPLARKLAAEHAIDLATLTGTGPGGRIVEADVLAAVPRPPPSPATAARGGSPAVQRRVPLTGLRRAIADRLRHSLNTAVPLTLTREVEAGLLVAARDRLSAAAALSVPFDAFFARLLAEALQEHPALNSSLDGDELVLYADVNVGVAVSLPAGLVVPVLRAVPGRPLLELAAEIRSLAAQAREGGLRPEAQAGGTCTITNLGAAGIDAFTPVINPPQSCILGIGRIRPRPVARDGALVLAPTCVLSLTFDHRVTDGAPAAALLDAIARRMNDATCLDALISVP